ncbi:MAG TPA: PAS domain S-box protein, partial [Actinomycetota bacterium]|nr:PAS domain S-box protein [Actinomycetota bacterium]
MRTGPMTAGGDVFRRAMHDAAIGMSLVAIDGTYLEVNSALCEILGYDAATLYTMTWQELTHPQDLEADLEHVGRLLAGTTDSYHMRKRFIRASGEVLTAYLTVSGIRDVTGQLEMFVSQVIDITHEAELEENLRMLAENGTEVITRLTNDGTLRWISPSVTRTTGWAPEQLLDVPFIGLVHPDDRAGIQNGTVQLGAGESAAFNARLIHADGSFSWFAINMDPVRNPTGKMVGRIATWRGIDAEMEANTLVSRREAEFRMLAENATDVVIRIGQDGLITWVSPSTVSALGWDTHEVIGMRPNDFLHPHDLAEIVERVRSLSPDEPTVDHPRRVMLADGSYRWFSIKASLVVDEQGQPAGRVLGLRDIDEEIRTRAALEASERVFRTAMESAPGGMAVMSLDEEFLQVNKALSTMLSRHASWLVGRRMGDVLHPEDLPEDREMCRQVRAGMQLSAVKECRLLRADGTVVWVEHAVGLVRDESGRPVSYVSQFVDISEARESRRELEFLARHDPLTRLSNRRSLVDQMRQVLTQTPRTGTQIAVLFLDVDGLKGVNDARGHAAGDELIVHVARR